MEYQNIMVVSNEVFARMMDDCRLYLVPAGHYPNKVIDGIEYRMCGILSNYPLYPAKGPQEEMQVNFAIYTRAL